MPRRKGAGKKTTFIGVSRNKKAAEKAVIHNLLGAGKSKVKREFFQLNEQDVDKIFQEMSNRLRARL